MTFEELSQCSLITLYVQKPRNMPASENLERKVFLRTSSLTELDSCRCRRLFHLRALEAHRILLAVAIHTNVIPRQHFALENLHRQWILNQSLDRSTQRPRSVRRVVTLAQQQLFRRRR